MCIYVAVAVAIPIPLVALIEVLKACDPLTVKIRKVRRGQAVYIYIFICMYLVRICTIYLYTCISVGHIITTMIMLMLVM